MFFTVTQTHPVNFNRQDNTKEFEDASTPQKLIEEYFIGPCSFDGFLKVLVFICSVQFSK